jgi:AP2 domain
VDPEANCRWATRLQQLRNRAGWSGTGYKGVVYKKARPEKWMRACYEARITVDGRRIYLGTRETAVEAARLYDRAGGCN